MARKYVRYFVTGTVVGVGYEMLVKIEAQRLDVLGFVREYEDGIEVLASIEEDKIEEFRKAISKRAKPDDVLVINVEQVEQYLEGEEKFMNKPVTFENFEIQYDFQISQLDRTKLEIDMMKLLVESENYRNLRRLRDEIKELKDELAGLHSTARKSVTETTNLNKALGELGADVRRIRESAREIREEVHKEKFDVSYGNVKPGPHSHNHMRTKKRKESVDPSYL